MGLFETIKKDLDCGAARLVEENRDRLMVEAVRLCPDHAEAEDLVFRTFEEAIRCIQNYRGEGSFYDWLCGILRNQHKMACRKRGDRVLPVGGTEDLPEAEHAEADEKVLANSDGDALRAAVEALPKDYREAVILHYYEDLPTKTIARILSISDDTVRQRLSRARRILKAKLGKVLRDPVLKTVLFFLAFGATFASGAWIGYSWLTSVKWMSRTGGDMADGRNWDFGGALPPPMAPVQFGRPQSGPLTLSQDAQFGDAWFYGNSWVCDLASDHVLKFGSVRLECGATNVITSGTLDWTGKTYYLADIGYSPRGRRSGTTLVATGKDTVLKGGALVIGTNWRDCSAFIRDGATLQVSEIDVGRSGNPAWRADSNRLEMSGSGTRLIDSGSLMVGIGGWNNFAALREGASARIGKNVHLGYGSCRHVASGDGNRLVIDGSAMDVKGGFYVGYESSSNTVEISGGARVAVGWQFVVSNARHREYTATETLGGNRAFIRGTGTLLRTGSGASGSGFWAGRSGSTDALVEISGGARLENCGEFKVGDGHSRGSTVRITSGATVVHSGFNIYVGVNTNDCDSAMIVDGGALKTSGAILRVGHAARNSRLEVTNGGSVDAGEGRVEVRKTATLAFGIPPSGAPLPLACGRLVFAKGATLAVTADRKVAGRVVLARTKEPIRLPKEMPVRLDEGLALDLSVPTELAVDFSKPNTK